MKAGQTGGNVASEVPSKIGGLAGKFKRYLPVVGIFLAAHQIHAAPDMTTKNVVAGDIIMGAVAWPYAVGSVVGTVFNEFVLDPLVWNPGTGRKGPIVATPSFIGNENFRDSQIRKSLEELNKKTFAGINALLFTENDTAKLVGGRTCYPVPGGCYYPPLVDKLVYPAKAVKEMIESYLNFQNTLKDNRRPHGLSDGIVNTEDVPKAND